MSGSPAGARSFSSMGRHLQDQTHADNGRAIESNWIPPGAGNCSNDAAIGKATDNDLKQVLANVTDLRIKGNTSDTASIRAGSTTLSSEPNRRFRQDQRRRPRRPRLSPDGRIQAADPRGR